MGWGSKYGGSVRGQRAEQVGVVSGVMEGKRFLFFSF